MTLLLALLYASWLTAPVFNHSHLPVFPQMCWFLPVKNFQTTKVTELLSAWDYCNTREVVPDTWIAFDWKYTMSETTLKSFNLHSYSVNFMAGALRDMQVKKDDLSTLSTQVIKSVIMWTLISVPSSAVTACGVGVQTVHGHHKNLDVWLNNQF